MIINIFTVLGIIILGMIGGQCKKWTRRYVLPSLIVAYTACKDKKNKTKSLIYLSLIGILSMGYGENSWIRKLCRGSDKATRIVYGLIVSIPFIFFGKWWACIVLPLAWSVRAGGFVLPNGKDFLFEDLIRYATIGLLVVL